MLLGLSVTSRRVKKFRHEILLLSLSITRQILGEKIRTKNFVVGSVCHTSARHPATLEWPQILITYNFRAMLCSKKTRGTFPRCKKRLPSDSFLRRLVIEAIVLVRNYRTEYIGYNQIQTVFDPEYVRCENLQGYDRISQYYFRPGE